MHEEVASRVLEQIRTLAREDALLGCLVRCWHDPKKPTTSELALALLELAVHNGRLMKLLERKTAVEPPPPIVLRCTLPECPELLRIAAGRKS